MKSLIILTPFNRHGHLREPGPTGLMQHILKYTASQYWGMIVMPNTEEPVTMYQQADRYRTYIKNLGLEQKLPSFTPVMTAYLTDTTDPKNIRQGFEMGIWKSAKLYPHGATTNSDKGVSNLEKIFPVLAEMEKIGMSLLVHPETEAGRHTIPFTDRERVYTEESLTRIHKEFPSLIISVEHITTVEATQFVESCPDNVVGTITPQHIMYTHDALFHNGVPPYKPGMYAENMCLPILKWQSDVDYILNAIMFGEKKYKFGAGDDTAVHTQISKHDHCSRCGVFNAMHSVEFYTMVFDEALMFETEERKKIFEDFMSVNNLWVYGIQPSNETITIEKRDQHIPELVDGNLRPFKAGQIIPWTIIPRL